MLHPLVEGIADAMVFAGLWTDDERRRFLASARLLAAEQDAAHAQAARRAREERARLPWWRRIFTPE